MYFSKAMYLYNTLGAVINLCYLDNKRFPHHVMWKLVNRIYTCLLPITLHHVSTSHDVQLLLSDFLITHSYTIVSQHVMCHLVNRKYTYLLSIPGNQVSTSRDVYVMLLEFLLFRVIQSIHITWCDEWAMFVVCTGGYASWNKRSDRMVSQRRSLGGGVHQNLWWPNGIPVEPSISEKESGGLSKVFLRIRWNWNSVTWRTSKDCLSYCSGLWFLQLNTN